MLQVTVALPSGRSASLSVPQSSNVRDLKALAQEYFGTRFLQLVAAEGRILTDIEETLQDAGFEDGALLTAVVRQVTIAATSQAFALWSRGCGMATWGRPEAGGDSSAVRDRPRSVQQVQSTIYAFAAILENGSVITWGKPETGGDSSAVQDQLKNVQQVQATQCAFAAILEDGSVVTWDRSAGSGHMYRICCDPGRWLSSDLGRSRRRW